MEKKISYQEAVRLNDEKLKEVIENAGNMTPEEVKEALEKVWDDVAKNIDYNL